MTTKRKKERIKEEKKKKEAMSARLNCVFLFCAFNILFPSYFTCEWGKIL